MKKVKSLIAIILVLVLAVSNLPVQAHAISDYETNINVLIEQLPEISNPAEFYYYSQLSDFEKVMYWKISEAIEDNPEIVITNLEGYTEDQLNNMSQNALDAWIADQPDISIYGQVSGETIGLFGDMFVYLVTSDGGGSTGCDKGHSWQPASCEEPKYCPVCGMFEGAPLGHKMGDWVTVKEASCITDGEMRKDCSRCDYYEKEPIPANGHNDIAVVTEATCTQKGYTTYTCTVCHDSRVGDYVKELGHDWQKDSCTEPKYCLVCGAFDSDSLEHDMTDWVILKKASCTTDGEMRRDCNRCDYYEKEPIPASGHNDMTVVTEATCTQKGYTTYTCTVCHDSRVGDYVDALGHNWQAATCTEPKFCPTCGTFEGMPADHAMGKWSTVNEATCTADGKMRRDCGLCDYYEQGAIPAKGHTDKEKNYICDVCGKDLCTDHQPKTVAGKAATCTETGLTDGKSCALCGDILETQKVISAKGHAWKDATCTHPKTCKTCGATSGRAKGHTYSNGLDGTCNTCSVHRETTENRTVMHMFRLYDPNSGEHFYTGSVEERENLVAAGWNYEGVGFTFSRTTGMPVYRLYDPVYGEHLYTMQQPVKTGTQYEGKDLYECEGRIWLYEGIAFNSAYDTEVPQYRLRNPNATRGAYHFTSSTVERDNLIAAGWISEGICFYSSWK